MRYDNTGTQASKTESDAQNQIILESVRQWRDDYVSRNKKCQYCQYTGMVMAERNADKLKFIFRCIYCDAAERQHLSQSIPTWEVGKLIHEYTPLI